jgi:hypothetical protein
MRSSTVVLLQSLVVLAFQFAIPHSFATEPQSVEALLQDLGNIDPKIQEKATRELLKREDAAPVLRKALNTADKETAKVVQGILRAFGKKEVMLGRTSNK